MAVAASPDERALERGLMSEETISATEAAARLGVHPNTMYRILATGSLPLRTMRVGGQWRISKADVDQFLAIIDAEGSV